jgi:hypothetical protein
MVRKTEKDERERGGNFNGMSQKVKGRCYYSMQRGI